MLSISKTATAQTDGITPSIERRAAFVRNMREFGNRRLFPALIAIACILVPCTIIIPVIANSQ